MLSCCLLLPVAAAPPSFAFSRYPSSMPAALLLCSDENYDNLRCAVTAQQDASSTAADPGDFRAVIQDVASIVKTAPTHYAKDVRFLVDARICHNFGTITAVAKLSLQQFAPTISNNLRKLATPSRSINCLRIIFERKFIRSSFHNVVCSTPAMPSRFTSIDVFRNRQAVTPPKAIAP
ncbi:unnamed protein product [Caenorhabditis angaria]|uniref:Ground-like domain-containing protein n=1 Tax=Caenorhabditis angaria TaxID=860376 RepID=A0A9P1MUJ0_9PELO|nr:unnamed protein product [Caenorhabditis angaria]